MTASKVPQFSYLFGHYDRLHEMPLEPFAPYVAPEIWQRFPGYRALSVVIRGFSAAETSPAAASQPSLPSWCDLSIEAWHTAFRQFGSNPKRTAPSFDSLIRRFRKDGALPVISPIVDCYNALSVQFAAPFGGEDIDRYSGVPRLVLAGRWQRNVRHHAVRRRRGGTSRCGRDHLARRPRRNMPALELAAM